MTTRILVCDDEVHIARAVSIKLTKAGFDVEIVSDGVAALEAIRREVPALLITDCQMPRMGGLELCRRLRDDPLTARLPIMLLTAKGYELDQDELIKELQLSQLLVKPFSPRELLRLVRETLQTDGAVATDTTSVP